MIIDSYRGSMSQLPESPSDENITQITLWLMGTRHSLSPNPDG